MFIEKFTLYDEVEHTANGHILVMYFVKNDSHCMYYNVVCTDFYCLFYFYSGLSSTSFSVSTSISFRSAQHTISCKHTHVPMS